MERNEVFIKITSNDIPAFLYAPGAYVSLRVESGQIYRLTMTDGELQSLIDAKLAEVAAPGTFTTFYALVQGDPRMNGGAYHWEKTAV